MFGFVWKIGRSPQFVISTLTIFVAAAIAASVANGGILEDQLRTTRSQGRDVKHKLSVVQRRQQVEVKAISSLNAKLRTMQQPVDELDAQIGGLNSRIDGRRRRIAKLKSDFVAQKEQISQLGGQLGEARDQLTKRVVATYKSGDAGVIEQLAGAVSIRNLLDREEAIGQAVGLDQHVIDRITDTQRDLRLQRASNHKVQRDIAHEIEKFQSDRGALEKTRAEYQRKVDAVAAVKLVRDRHLKALNSEKQNLSDRLEGIESDEKTIQEVIRTGTATYGGEMVGQVSPAGLIWPVNGPVVSPFGHRWGRMHEGVDIAVGMGTPIHAAASGIVTYASWENGYGNFVTIQHGGNLVTAYGHQSKIAVHVGQAVQQGQVIGFVGCTGHCFGPHLHFETRHGTTPADPMQYL